MGAKAEVTPVANWRDVTRFMAWTLGICFLMLALVWAWSETTHFLMMDSRFVLAIPELGEESKGIIVDGVKNANRTTIATLFSDDYGRSIYRIPIAERRRRLLGLNSTASVIPRATSHSIWLLPRAARKARSATSARFASTRGT